MLNALVLFGPKGSASGSDQVGTCLRMPGYYARYGACDPGLADQHLHFSVSGRITRASDGFCLDVAGAEPKQWASVRTIPCNGRPSQSFYLTIDPNDGRPVIKSEWDSTLCLHQANGGLVKLRRCDASPSLWDFTTPFDLAGDYAMYTEAGLF